MKKGCGAGFKASDIHIRQEEGTELKHVTFENMTTSIDTRWRNSPGRVGGNGFGDAGG